MRNVYSINLNKNIVFICFILSIKQMLFLMKFKIPYCFVFKLSNKKKMKKESGFFVKINLVLSLNLK